VLAADSVSIPVPDFVKAPPVITPPTETLPDTAAIVPPNEFSAIPALITWAFVALLVIDVPAERVIALPEIVKAEAPELKVKPEIVRFRSLVSNVLLEVANTSESFDTGAPLALQFAATLKFEPVGVATHVLTAASAL
jgi:hypothetical protein